MNQSVIYGFAAGSPISIDSDGSYGPLVYFGEYDPDAFGAAGEDDGDDQIPVGTDVVNILGATTDVLAGKIQLMYEQLERLSACEQLKWKESVRQPTWNRAALKALGLKGNRAPYSDDQKKAALGYARNFLNKKDKFGMKAQNAVRMIPGYGKVTYTYLNRWATKEVKKKRGRKIHMDFDF